MEPLRSGYLSQLTKNNSKMWKKRYFVLLPDGTLSIADKKGSPPKQVFYLSNNSDISDIPPGEIKGDTGFYVNVSSYQLLCVKSGKKSEVEKWNEAVSGLLKQFDAQAKKRERLSVSDIYAKMASAEKKNKKTRVRGYTMKVGKSTDAQDYFVNANTFEYFLSEDDCKRGQAPVGKAQITYLV